MAARPDSEAKPAVGFEPTLGPADLRTAARVTEPAKPSRSEPSFEPTKPVETGAAEPSEPADKDFDFDFGFAKEPPRAIPTPQPRPPVAAAPVAAPSAPAEADDPEDDPIADLIAAELDGIGASKPAAPVATAPTGAPRPPVEVSPPLASLPSTGPAAPQRPVNVQPQVPRANLPVAAMPEESRAPSAPVFGTPQRPQSSAPVERDPMDEIESLIGEAVRVELSAPEKQAQAAPQQVAAPPPAPMVPPLTTGFAPRRATIKETEPEVPSAEAAILAAAAASGAEVGRIDNGFVGDRNPYKRPKAKPERRTLLQSGLRQYVAMAVAGTLLLAAGFGLYWVLGMSRDAGDADVPVLSADTTPAKEAPPLVPAKPEAQGSVVFNELGGNSTPPVDEQLVSRDDSAETSVADVAKPVGADAAPSGESELANRKVRTVTVRPDGSIVSGDDAVAGTEELPVDRPNVPDLPGADVQPSELLAALPTNDGTATPAAAPAAPAAGATDPIGALAAAPDAVAPGITPDATSTATIDPTVVAPVPMARPGDRSVLGGGSNQRVAAVQTPAAAPVDLVPAAPAAAAAAPAAPSGPYVQLSSQPTEGDARAALQRTQNQLSALLNGRALAVRQVDLGAKGTWYRVVLPVSSFQEATQTCASLKANGQDCVPING